jgi:CRP/FNR family transcriptional regulator, cyclic AMP receptor protein
MPTPYNLDLHDDCAECTVRGNGMICDLAPESVQALDKIKFTGIYPKGSLLFVEGEQPRGVFFICSGRVKLTTSSSEGKRLIVKLAEAGEVLGASATILGKPYEVSAETIEPAQLNFVRRDDFLRLLESHADVCMHVAKQLSEKYQAAQRDLRSLGLSQTTSVKLARLLLEWAGHRGEVTERGTRVTLLLTHEEAAQMIGTTRETVTRILSSLRKREVIAINGASLYILNREQLEELAGQRMRAR